MAVGGLLQIIIVGLLVIASVVDIPTTKNSTTPVLIFVTCM